MRAVGPREELRMELRPEHPGMVAQLTDLHQGTVGRNPAGDQTRMGKQAAVGVIELVTMAVPLGHDIGPVGPVSATARRKAAWVGPEPHRSALLLNTTLLGKHADDGDRGDGIELSRIDILGAKHMARKL